MRSDASGPLGHARRSLPELALVALSLAPRGEWTELDALRLAAVFWIAARIGRRARSRWLAELSGTEALLAAFALASGIVLGALTWLGAAGWLRFPVAGVTLAVLSLGLAIAPPAERPAATPETAPGASRRPHLVALAVALTLITVAVEMRGHRYTPPGVYTYDEVSYHLPAAVTWLRHGDLRTPKPTFGDPATPFYPVGGEIVSWFLLAPFGDSDLAARWSELPAGLGLLLAVFALGRRFGLSPEAASAAVLLTLTIPRLVPQLLLSAGNDVWNGFALLATLHALSRWRERGGLPYAGWTGVCAGLLVGVKYLGVLELALLLALAGATAGARWARREVAVAVALASFVGGFAYLRNAIAAGNPVYPQGISIAGADLLRGLPGAGLGERDLGEEARAVAPLGFLVGRTDQFGAVWRWTALPAAVLAPFVALAAGGGASRRRSLWMLVAPVLYIVWVWLLHDHRDLRFLVGPIALSTVSFGWLLDRWDERARGWLASGATLALAFFLAVRRGDDGRWLAGCALALVAAVSWNRLRAWPAARRRRLLRLGAAAAVAALVAGSSAWTAEYLRLRTRYQPVAAELERLTGGRPVSIAYVGGNRPYFLFGNRLQNSVHVVPTAGPVEEQYWDFGRSPTFPPRHRSSRAFARNVNELGVTWMLVERTGFEYPERSMVADWRHWQLAARVQDVELWRVRP